MWKDVGRRIRKPEGGEQKRKKTPCLRTLDAKRRGHSHHSERILASQRARPIHGATVRLSVREWKHRLTLPSRKFQARHAAERMIQEYALPRADSANVPARSGNARGTPTQRGVRSPHQRAHVRWRWAISECGYPKEWMSGSVSRTVDGGWVKLDERLAPCNTYRPLDHRGSH